MVFLGAVRYNKTMENQELLRCQDNYYASKRNRKLKQTLMQLPVTLFCEY
jgi:hypothetical protein